MELTRHPFLIRFDPVHREELRRAAVLRAFPEGEMIFDEGAESHSIFLTLSGEVRFLKHIGRDHLEPIGVLREGEFFGEVALLDGRPRSLRAVAGSACNLAEIPRDVALGILGRSPGTVALEIFSGVLRNLRDTMQNFQSASLARFRMESELKVAREIQLSLLPPDGSEDSLSLRIDIHGLLRPAHDIGGDLYDFFPVGPTRLCFMVADVCGKGIASALFVAVVKTLLKVIAGSEPSPARILAGLTHHLCAHNPQNMFVTVFCGILDLETGDLVYTRGGHEPALIRRAKDDILDLDKGSGPVVGILPDAVFRDDFIQLPPGGSLVIHTDGITEAMNPVHELYGPDRLKACVAAARYPGSSHELVESIVTDVSHHVGSAPQSDDITLLVLTRPLA